MMMPLDPSGAPVPVTPADSPSNPDGYAQVAPAGRGPAPYDIQAPTSDLAQATADAVALSGPGGPRQQATDTLLSSGQGYGDLNITSGYSGGAGEDWLGDIAP